MESLPPLGEHERQYEDMLYSPDDFDPDKELPVTEFSRFFRLRAVGLIESYREKGIPISRYLMQESRYTDEELSEIFTVMKRVNKKDAMSWGDFRNFITEWEADWDSKHPLP